MLYNVPMYNTLTDNVHLISYHIIIYWTCKLFKYLLFIKTFFITAHYEINVSTIIINS